MSLETTIAVIVVALIISSLAAIAGYYLQNRLKRLEDLERGADVPVRDNKAESTQKKKTEIRLLPTIPIITASLVMTSGPMIGRTFTLSAHTLIGRDPSLGDIVINSPLVSAKHAKIRLEEGHFYLYDLASTNGTLVNGIPVLRTELLDGDRIAIGDVNMKFQRSDPIPVPE